MNKTKIEWCDLSINPIKGLCPVGCSYCYARRMYRRFKWDETIRFDDSVLYGLPKEPKRIFVGSTMELFGKWVKDSWMEHIIQMCVLYPQHTFIFLTKEPHNLPDKWPDNFWVGVSITGKEDVGFAYRIAHISAKVKFLSIEPLLTEVNICSESIKNAGINWVIIGQQTPQRESTKPKVKWIADIITKCDKVGIPVFLKNNLDFMLPEQHPLFRKNQYYLRQEFPL